MFLGLATASGPRRSPLFALAAQEKAVMTQRVNWVLDLDIRTFFRLGRPRVAGSDAGARDR